MIKERKYNFTILILAVLFFFVYAYLVWSIWLPQWLELKHIIFNWPDANANFFFARLWAEQGTLASFEPLNLASDNLLHTRSINVFNGNLVPVGFLPSILVYAASFKIFGILGILLLTPALAALSIYFIYRLSYYIFSDLDFSLTIAVLFSVLAPWLYFANIVMLPTIMFVFFVLAGFLSLAKFFQTNKWFWWILTGFLLSLAVFVRPTEIVWLAVTALFVLYWQRKKIDYKKIISCLIIFAILVFVSLYLNKITYGSYFVTGYFDLQNSGQPTEFSGQGTNYFKFLLMPFGFSPSKIFYNFGKYFVELNWYIFVLALSGILIRLIKKECSLAWRNYAIISIIIFVLVFLYYGSWDLADPLVKNLNSISISYVRYFMPLYILILPLAAYAIKFLSKDKIFYAAFILLAFIFGFKVAFYSPNDGLIATRDNLLSYQNQYQQVENLVESNAIIITDRSDKIFFSKYRVIVPQGDLPFWQRVASIIDTQAIYYFTDKSPELIVKDRLAAQESSLNISDATEIDKNFKLYKIIKSEE